MRIITYIRPCILNYLFLLPVRANLISSSRYILCSIVVEYLISDNNPIRVYIVAIVFLANSEFTCFYGSYYLLWWEKLRSTHSSVGCVSKESSGPEENQMHRILGDPNSA